MELKKFNNKNKSLYFKKNEIYDFNNKIKFISELWQDQKPNSEYSIIEEDDYIFNEHIEIKDYCDIIPKHIIDIFKNRRSYLLSEFNSNWVESDVYKLINLAMGISGAREISYRNTKKEIENKILKLRTYPSGGGLYSIDIYIYIKGIENIEEGLYLLNIHKNVLVKLRNKVSLSELEKISQITYLKLDEYSNSFDKTNMLIFLVANYSKNFDKYGILSYKLAMLEAGHIAQNIQLVSTILNKRSLPLCGYYDDKVEEFLSIDGDDKVCLYLLALG